MRYYNSTDWTSVWQRNQYPCRLHAKYHFKISFRVSQSVPPSLSQYSDCFQAYLRWTGWREMKYKLSSPKQWISTLFHVIHLVISHRASCKKASKAYPHQQLSWPFSESKKCQLPRLQKNTEKKKRASQTERKEALHNRGWKQLNQRGLPCLHHTL